MASRSLVSVPISLLAGAALAALACGSPVNPSKSDPVDAGSDTLGPGTADLRGTAQITGGVTGVPMDTTTGVSIAKLEPPALQIKIAVSAISCTATDVADHITIDVANAAVGSYTVVKGYPRLPDLAGFQARAHICPAKVDATSDAGVSETGFDAGPPPCHDQLRVGTVELTRVDNKVNGTIEGKFDLTFTDGQVTGTFSAPRCN